MNAYFLIAETDNKTEVVGQCLASSYNKAFLIFEKRKLKGDEILSQEDWINEKELYYLENSTQI